ncbi:MAG: RDD family protein [Tissierellales bacterium]|nr:RDD family protein [Tissierellales bacterium]
MNSNKELIDSWSRATDSMVIQAATKNWNEYSPEAQQVIEVEVQKRGLSDIVSVSRGGKNEKQARFEVLTEALDSGHYLCEACKSTNLNESTGRCASCELPSEYVGYCIECDKFWFIKPGGYCPEHNTKLQKHKPAMALLRFGNFIFDKLLAYVFFMIIFIVWGILGIIDENTFENINPSLDLFLSWLLFYLYYLFFESLWQRTPAKFITGTKVIMGDGSKPTVGTIALRTLIRFIPFEAFSFLGERVHGWHDRWSNTYVIKAQRFGRNKNDIPNQRPNSNEVKLETTTDGNVHNMPHLSAPDVHIKQMEGNSIHTNMDSSELNTVTTQISLKRPHTCANCESIIGKLEKAYSFKGNIICHRCKSKLTE